MSGTGPEPLRTRALPESSRDLTQGRIELARSGECAEHRGMADAF